MTDQKPEQERQVTPKGAVEVDEEQLDQAAGGALLGTSLGGEGKTVKIDFCKNDPTIDAATDPSLSKAGYGGGKI